MLICAFKPKWKQAERATEDTHIFSVVKPKRNLTFYMQAWRYGMTNKATSAKPVKETNMISQFYCTKKCKDWYIYWFMLVQNQPWFTSNTNLYQVLNKAIVSSLTITIKCNHASAKNLLFSFFHFHLVAVCGLHTLLVESNTLLGTQQRQYKNKTKTLTLIGSFPSA